MWKFEPPKIYRNIVEPIDRFQVLGDRCSGTNFLSHLVRSNFTELQETQELGWKHGFIDRTQTASRGLLVIVVRRHPVRWLSSVHRTPFELAQTMRDISFGQFIRAQWDPVWRLDTSTGIVAKPAIEDMIPGTTKRFANALQMRAAKIRYLQALRDEAANVAFVRYEDVNKNPKATLLSIANGCDVTTSQEFSQVRRYRGGAKADYRPRFFPRICSADRAYLASKIDNEAEKLAGYHIDDVPIFDGLSFFDSRTLQGFKRRLIKGA